MKLFISYRRKSWSFTHLLSEKLKAHIEATIFIDYTSIDETDFEQSILRHLRESDIVLVITTEYTFAQEQIHDNTDWVRREIALALDLKKLIIPILVDGLRLPSTDELPINIRGISRIQGITFYPEYFDAGIEKLVRFINKISASTTSLKKENPSIQLNQNIKPQATKTNELDTSHIYNKQNFSIQDRIPQNLEKPLRWTLRSYKYLETESRYQIHEDNSEHHTFKITTKIEALESGVNIFENTYRWTGRGIEQTPTVISPGHAMLGEVLGDSGWKYYYIHLGKPLNKGDTAVIETVQELYDREHSFEPYIAKIISQPVDLLTLRVILPPNSLPFRADFIEWASERPTSNIVRSMQGIINYQKGEIYWEVIKPLLKHKYEIRWQY